MLGSSHRRIVAKQRWGRRGLVLFAWLGLGGSLPTLAIGSQFKSPTPRTALLTVKTLSYDRSFGRSDETSFTLGIVAGNSAEVTRLALDLRGVFARLQAKKRRCVPIVVTYESEKQFKKEVTTQNIDALFVMGGLDAEVSKISSIARQLKLPTFSTDLTYLASGLGVAFIARGTRTKIVVHLENAKAQGMSFPTSFLSVATVVR